MDGDAVIRGVISGDGSGLSNIPLTGLDTNAIDARYVKKTGDAISGNLSMGGQLFMNNNDIKSGNIDGVLALLGGSEWNNGAMFQLGADNNTWLPDVANGSAQLILKNATSRFRVRRRDGWIDLLAIGGNGSLQTYGPITQAGQTLDDRYMRRTNDSFSGNLSVNTCHGVTSRHYTYELTMS